MSNYALSNVCYFIYVFIVEHHYGHNKERNKLVRSDLQEARSAQKSEEEEARMVRLAYEKMLKEQ